MAEEENNTLKTKYQFGNEDPVPCILCDLVFNLSDDIQPFLSHLLESHNFLIEAPMEILDLREYIIYWRKLKSRRLEDYCIVFTTNSEAGAKSPQRTYHLLSHRLPEDQVMRSDIKDNKLLYISDQMRAEWEDKSFSRKCVYCAKVIGGGLSKVLNHIKFDHNISLGSNIVFGAKLLDIIEDKLQKLLCLYCENQFTNHVSLREHMRKKHHKSLNPKNKAYDKFYLVNYIKPGTSWEEANQELRDELDDEEVDKEQCDEIKEWEGWETGEANETISTCLFCGFSTSEDPSKVYNHMEAQHRYNFEKHTEKMSFYNRVKIVNYIRTKISHFACISCSAVYSCREELLRHMEKNSHFAMTHSLWDNTDYLIPFLKNDGMLQNINDDEELQELSSGYESSNPDEMVFPEPIPRYLEPNQTQPGEFPATTGDEENDLEHKCLFCSYSSHGHDSKGLCTQHMEWNHCFKYDESIERLSSGDQIKLVNYIRFKTYQHQCYFCHKALNSETSLVVHLQLCDRARGLEHFEYLHERWNTPRLGNDAFILDVEKRIHKNTIANEASSTREETDRR